MSYADKTLACRDCGQAFIFTSGEQEFFAQKGFNDPSRCPSCRASRRSERSGSTEGYGGGYSGSGYNADPYRSEDSGFGGGEFGGGYGRPERQLYSAICANCGNESQVPFQPRGDRPVYCSECFRSTRGSSGGGYGRRDYP